MNIGINGYEAVIPRFGFNGTTGLPNRVGSSEYCFKLLVHLAQIDKKNSYTIYLPTVPTADLPGESETWKYKIISTTKLWTIFGLTKALLSKPNLDVFFSPTHYGPIFVSFAQVISILDVSYKHYPELFNRKDRYQLALWGRYSIKKAAKILTISESSKHDIIEEYKVSDSKVVVTYPGIKEISDKNNSLSMEDLHKKYDIKGKYILFVGTLQPRKNVARLIEAFALLKDKSTQLVIVGKKGWMYQEIIEAPKRLGVEDSVRFLDFVPDQDLPSLYKHAECFVLPSLYEGFGLPVLEAMSYGCPVVTSDISSLPEAGGDAAIYCDPYDVQDIAQKIDKVLDDKKLQEQMEKKGFEQIKKFSWDKAAKETLEVLEQVAK